MNPENFPLFSPQNGTLGSWRIHSRSRPGEEIRPVLDRIRPSSTPVLVWGLGLGYQLERVLSRFSDQIILLVEPHPEVWKVVKEGLPTTIANRNNVTVLGPGDLAGNAQSLIAYLAPKQSDPPPNLVILPAYRQAFPEICEKLEQRVRILEDRRSINLATLKRFGKLWLRNTLRNTYLYSEAQEIQSVFGKFSDIPALLFAGGPSLTRFLPFLSSLADHFLLVCVDTALRPILDSGLEPDFVIIVDPQYWNTRHLDRVGKVSSIFVTEISVHPRSMAPMNHPPLLSGSVFPLGDYLEEGRYRRLGAGGSVATTGWDFLKNLGVSEVVCVGMDLGFPDLDTHVAGSFSEGLKYLTSSRFMTEETQGVKFLYSGLPVVVEDYAGLPLLSDQRMNIYAAWFEARLKESGVPRTYNLGYQSRKIGGIEPLEVSSLLERTQPESENGSIRARVLEILKELKSQKFSPSILGQPSSLSKVDNRLGLIAKDLKLLLTITTRGIQMIEKFLVQSQTKNSAPNSSALLKKLDALDQEILGISSRRIIGFLIEDITQELQTLPPPQSFAESLERSLALYRGINGSTLWLQDEFG